tara:strand:+ start:1010 stop:1261 length:252 start_codon:yes stop_codon:yes gene_type:complete
MNSTIEINTLLTTDGPYSVHTETRGSTFYKVIECNKSGKRITVQRCKPDGKCDMGFSDPERATMQPDGRYKIVGRKKFLTINT